VQFAGPSVSAAVTIPPESELAALRATPTPEAATVARPPRGGSNVTRRPAGSTAASRPAVPDAASTVPPGTAQVLAPTGMAEPRSRLGFWIAFAVVLLVGLLIILLR
jgi:hypothetical protein